MSAEFRTGIGYDKHRLVPGGPLILGGIAIPFEKKSSGHSDGDVLIHAIVDALLGASALGDIGRHFPDSDPQWKNASSELFLKRALELTKELTTITFIDCIVLLEKPKLALHFDSIRENLSKLLGIGLNQVSLKAKTEEGLGEIGEGNAIAAFAVITAKVN